MRVAVAPYEAQIKDAYAEAAEARASIEQMRRQLAEADTSTLDALRQEVDTLRQAVHEAAQREESVRAMHAAVVAAAQQDAARAADTIDALQRAQATATAREESLAAELGDALAQVAAAHRRAAANEGAWGEGSTAAMEAVQRAQEAVHAQSVSTLESQLLVAQGRVAALERDLAAVSASEARQRRLLEEAVRAHSQEAAQHTVQVAALEARLAGSTSVAALQERIMSLAAALNGAQEALERKSAEAAAATAAAARATAAHAECQARLSHALQDLAAVTSGEGGEEVGGADGTQEAAADGSHATVVVVSSGAGSDGKLNSIAHRADAASLAQVYAPAGSHFGGSHRSRSIGGGGGPASSSAVAPPTFTSRRPGGGGIAGALTPLKRIPFIQQNAVLSVVATEVDAFTIRFTRLLLGSPVMRLAAMVWIVLAHLWLLFVVLFHTHALPHTAHTPKAPLILNGK